eukprot:4488644-Amphidinium_carterae.1
MGSRSRPLRGLLVIGLALVAIRSELFAVPGNASHGHLRQVQTGQKDVVGATLAGFPTSVPTVQAKQDASSVEADKRSSFAGVAQEQQKFDSVSLLLAAAGAATAMSAASAA